MAPVAPVIATISRRGAAARVSMARGALSEDNKDSDSGRLSRGEQLLQFARFVHFHHDVRAADEFALHVELRNGRPVREPLDALADFVVFEHVAGFDFAAAPRLRSLDG